MYAKLFTSIYQGTLRGNSHGLLVFTNLLAHADMEGRVDIHPRAIAEEVGLTVEEVKKALLVLESTDDESRSPEEQGRRIVRLDEHRAWGWIVVNYVKYRSIRNEDDRREQNRRSQAAWRAKQKDVALTVSEVSRDKPRSAHTEAEVHTEEEIKRALPVSEAGLVCKAMKKAGVQGVNPSHPKLKALIDAGATTDEFTDAASAAAQHGKGFAYALAVVEGRRKDAAKTLEQVHKGSMPVAETSFTKDRKSQAQAWMGKIKQPDTIDMEQTNVSRLKMD